MLSDHSSLFFLFQVNCKFLRTSDVVIVCPDRNVGIHFSTVAYSVTSKSIMAGIVTAVVGFVVTRIVIQLCNANH